MRTLVSQSEIASKEPTAPDTSLAALAGLLLLTSVAHSAEPNLGFFESRIRPVLIEHCYECHSIQSDDLMGGLRLDSREGWQRGGDSGTAVRPGQPEQSLLLDAISYRNPDLQMPPDGILPARVIDDFRKWIESGAPDPRDAAAGPPSGPGFDLAARKADHWAWHPLRPIPETTTIDELIDRRVHEEGLTAAEPARARVLLRRLTYDLTGLPPKPAELERFVAHSESDPESALEAAVQRLLDSPSFGEHWTRHWLDVARFSETKGHVTDQGRPYAWKYRDYVIDCFNDDVPYDRFLVEHIAGDLLPPSEWRTGHRGEENVTPTATGVLFMHEMHFMAVDPLKQRWDEIDAQIDVVSKAFLGLTTECARCHDHKFDAISQRDYYALAGFFYSTEQSKQRCAPRQPVDPSQRDKLRALEDDYDQFLYQKREGRLQAQQPKVGSQAYFPVSEELGIQSPRDGENLVSKMKALEEIDPSWSYWVRAAMDVAGQDASLLVRGNHRNPGETVPRRFLEAMGGREFPHRNDPARGSGRRWLAEQIAHPDNPLTARVWVNRLWHHLFGRGIVATPSNFGKLGAEPTHPELLDLLARRLMESGWSTKSVIREIVTSRAYRRSSVAAGNDDPENMLFSRQNRSRLRAEQIRDAMLAVSGSLDETRYGPSIDCYVPPYATANKPSNVPKSGPLDGDNRRSIYLKVRRNFFDPFLLTFDFPDRSKSVGKRAVTLVPGQALAMLNSPLVHELASDWGQRLAGESGTVDERLDFIWHTALGRAPEPNELQSMHQLAKEIAGGSSQLDDETLWTAVAHVVFNHPDFTWID